MLPLTLFVAALAVAARMIVASADVRRSRAGPGSLAQPLRASVSGSTSGGGGSADFFSRLPPFTDFARIVDADVYAPVPEDWWMVITDVQGSTAAIESGRYKEVNLAGASGIAAVTNAVATKVPFVFGGDGATFVIPPGSLETVRDALAKTQAFVRSTLDLSLRVGFVPVSELVRQDAAVRVARFQLSVGNELAMLRGGGAALAEKIVKKGPLVGGAFVLPIPEQASEARPDVSGLSCRWELIRAREGQVLSVLVVAREAERAEATYRAVLEGLQHIIGSGALAGNPVHTSQPRVAMRGPGARFERRARAGLRHLGALGDVTVWLTRLFLRALFALGIPVGPIEPRRYLSETAINADYRKFDDTLRFVLDCSPAQVEAIHEFLRERHAAGELFYGVHASDSAIMTCFVKSVSQNQHVHFIDGGDGGYAAAAKQLKAQLAGAREGDEKS